MIREGIEPEGVQTPQSSDATGKSQESQDRLAITLQLDIKADNLFAAGTKLSVLPCTTNAIFQEPVFLSGAKGELTRITLIGQIDASYPNLRCGGVLALTSKEGRVFKGELHRQIVVTPITSVSEGAPINLELITSP